MTTPLLEQTISGNLLRIFNTGVLILGSSGTGKSDTSLQLLTRGHALIADDSVTLHQLNETALAGSCPAAGKGFLFIYDLGLVDIPTTFGQDALVEKHSVDLVIQLTKEERPYSLESNDSVMLLGVPLPCFLLSNSAYRPTAILVETMTRCFLLQKSGENTLARFSENQRQLMDHVHS